MTMGVGKLYPLWSTLISLNLPYCIHVLQNFVTDYQYRQIFFTILGVSFCVARNGFNLIEIKNKNVRVKFINSSMPVLYPFFNWWGCCFRFFSHNIFPHWDGSIAIFDGFWIKFIFTQISLCINVFNLEKKLRVSISYLKPCLWLFIIMNLQWYKEKLFVNCFLRQLSQSLHLSHNQSPLDDRGIE